MKTRIDYSQINQRAFGLLASIPKHLDAIEPKLKALVDLRVSQINGCLFCVDMHSTEARAAGETQQRLDCLVAWQESPFFTDRERAALAWAESLTNVSTTHAPDEVYEELQAHFSEREIADLGLIVALMNTWNRLSIGFRKMPPLRE